MMNLLDNQKEAIEKLQKYKVGALFMEPGTGKTLTALELIKTTGLRKVLWFTPFQTINSLDKELKKYAHNLDIFIVGTESLSNSDRLYLEVLNKINKDWFIILDESLKIKNNNSKRSQRLINISKKADYKLILNGTPISKNLLDVWAQMEFLSPKILKMSYNQFKNTFVKYIQKTNGYSKIEMIIGYNNVDYLYRLIEPFVFENNLMINKRKTYINVYYSLDEQQKIEYNNIKEYYLNYDNLELMDNNIFFAMTTKLQMCYYTNDEKEEALKDIIDGKEEDFIIFCRYIKTQERIKELYPKASVLSYQKHSFGLNLQDKNKIIFFEKVWDFAIFEQAERRIYRTGQERDCFYYNFKCFVGLDDLIEENLKRKGRLLNGFKNKKELKMKL